MVTLPQLFRENGYETVGIGKIFHLSVDDPNRRALFEDPQSWGYFEDNLQNMAPLGRKGEGRNLTGGEIGWATWRAAEGGDLAQPDGQNAEALIKKLEEVHKEPFFIGYGIHKPHDQFIAPKEYFELYPKGSTVLENPPADRSELERFAVPNQELFSKFTDTERREFKRAYQACISFIDAQIGKVFETMDRLKLWDNTIVILMSDHGYHLGQKGWWNKVTLFETGARVPFIVWDPNARGMGQETESIVELVDIYPTLVDIAGLKAPHKLSGKSMRPILENPKTETKQMAFTQVQRGKQPGYTIRTQRWRYTEWGVDGELGVELYDHSKDPNEYYNLARNPEYAALRKNLKRELDKGFAN